MVFISVLFNISELAPLQGGWGVKAKGQEKIISFGQNFYLVV